MPTGTLAPSPWFVITDGNNNPIPGGKIRTKLAGTNTDEPVYSDALLTTPLSNPVVADGYGRVSFYLAAKTYKFIVLDASDVQIRVQDNVAAVHLNQNIIGDIFNFGGDSNAPITVTSYPTGTTFDKCHAGTRWFALDSGNLASGTYVLEGMLMGVGGGTVTAALVNLSDGNPNTAIATISSASTTGAVVQSGAITFAGSGASKTYAVKVKVDTGGGFAWGLTLRRTS